MIRVAGLVALIGGVAIAQPAGTPTKVPALAISEVLFNVPLGDADPSGDGKRSAVGDEFVELVNTTGRALELDGYAVVSRLGWSAPESAYGVRIVLPKMSLPKDGVLLIFNGLDTSLAGPVGTLDAPPTKPNKAFGGAYVLDWKNESRGRAFSNSGDFCLVLDAKGAPIDGVWWGKPSVEPPPRGAHGNYRLVEVDDDPEGSVVRDDLAVEAMVEHKEAKATAFSPGVR